MTTTYDDIAVQVFRAEHCGQHHGHHPCTKCLVSAALAEMEAALRGVLHDVDGLLSDGHVPKSCGACGTPNAACDGDCADASYIVNRAQTARAVLAKYGFPERPGETGDTE